MSGKDTARRQRHQDDEARRLRDRHQDQQRRDYEAAVKASKDSYKMEQLEQSQRRRQQDLAPAAKKPRMTRAAMKLATCPGVKEPSASGKIMRAIPEIWRAKAEPKEEPEEKPDLKLQDVADDVNKMLEENGSIAGLLGHDSTFSFSPLRRTRDGARTRVMSVAKAFDRVSLVSHLKKEEDLASLSPLPRPGRPTPTFTDDTIPWDISGSSRGEGRSEAATGSHRHHVVEVAHHHHHHHHNPAPAAHHHHHLPCLVSPPPAQMIFVDDCSHVSDEMGRHAPTAGFRARAFQDGEAAASPAPVSQQQVDLDNSELEEEKFANGMRKMVARAELHRAQQHRRRKP